MMQKTLASLLDDPPQEDSEDFSQEEVQRATVTTDADDLVNKIMHQVRGSTDSKFAVKSHELRRRDNHMFCRLRLVATHEPDKVLVYQIDWVKP